MDYIKKVTKELVDNILSSGVRDMPQNPAGQGYTERQIRGFYYIPEEKILYLIGDIENDFLNLIENKENVVEQGKGQYSIQGKNSVTKEKDRRNFANGEASFAGGHGSKTYQRDTVAYGGNCQAGMTEEEFNAYFWDETNQVPLHGGRGKNEQGQIKDNYNSTYAESYGFALAGGEGNKALARATLALIAYNTVTGEKSGAIGEHNEIPGKNSHSVGDHSKLFANFLQALGRYLWSETDKQILLGHHNLRDENALLIVGNGEENSGDKETSADEQGNISFHRRNAMTIKKNGAFHTDSRVNDTNMPVIEYYVENGQVKKRVVEGQYDKDIFHIRNLSFGDKTVDLFIDKDGNFLFETRNQNKENGLGIGYILKRFTIDQIGRMVFDHTVEASDETILDIKNRDTSARQLKVKANGQVIGGKSTIDDDEDKTLTTKDFVLRKISENGGGTSPNITADLAKKLDKRTDVTATHSVYAKSADGTQQWLVGYSSGDTPLTLAQRTHTGAVVVGTPTEDKHAIPMSYFAANKGTKVYKHTWYGDGGQWGWQEKVCSYYSYSGTPEADLTPSNCVEKLMTVLREQRGFLARNFIGHDILSVTDDAQDFRYKFAVIQYGNLVYLSDLEGISTSDFDTIVDEVIEL